MNTRRLLGLLIGLLAGMFLCCASTALLLAFGGGTPVAGPTPQAIPTGATLDVAIDEAYLSRTLAQTAKGYPSPWPVVGGRMDLQPGNEAVFEVLVDGPLGWMRVTGNLTFNVERGKLLIHVAQVKLGLLPVTGLIRAFAPSLEDQIVAKANQQLQERTAGTSVTLLGVTTDDQFLRLYFAGQ